MTGLIFDIKRFAVHDGPGIRTTVFLKGCPLRCSWCHNPEGIEPNPCKVNKVLKLNGRNFTKEETIGYEISTEKLFAELDKERVFMDESKGGVTFSGGEPLMQPEFLMEMLKICKKNGMHTVVDTSLFAPWETVENVSKLTDLFLVDLKLMNSAEHQLHTGVPNELILENIRKLSASDVAVAVRIPMIPNITTSIENISQSISFLQTLKEKIKEIELLPFHNRANEKYKRVGMTNTFENIKSLPKNELATIEQQFMNAGFTIKQC
ncbi:MAG: glycyl-radical enzyme activating protein [Bacteroidales bacterium]|jgi:pyruvate formate lyase activating enzyme|nr:glycyl-radical enzyme activating protein [Bacteroidales bacterium]